MVEAALVVAVTCADCAHLKLKYWNNRRLPRSGRLKPIRPIDESLISDLAQKGTHCGRRNTLPRSYDVSGYLQWATDSFLLATAIAQPKTSIHTHMCYCDFGDCMEAIDRLDADVNSIENGELP